MSDSTTSRTTSAAAAQYATATTAPDVEATATLTDRDVAAVRDAAGASWPNADMSAVTVRVAPLAGRRLAATIGRTITFDDNAAGFGWFVDTTPQVDEEFVDRDGRMLARAGSPASGRIDLVTVLAHELGHVAGFAHVDEDRHGDLMAGEITPGERRTETRTVVRAGGTASTRVQLLQATATATPASSDPPAEEPSSADPPITEPEPSPPEAEAPAESAEPPTAEPVPDEPEPEPTATEPTSSEPTPDEPTSAEPDAGATASDAGAFEPAQDEATVAAEHDPAGTPTASTSAAPAPEEAVSEPPGPAAPATSAPTAPAPALVDPEPAAPLVPAPAAMVSGAEPVAAVTVADAQIIRLDLDGAADLTYDGPVTIAAVDVPAFIAPGMFAGQEGVVVAAMLAVLELLFADQNVVFTIDPVADGVEHSVIYVGGTGSEFAEYGTLWGISEHIDHGNVDRADVAFVFSSNVASLAVNAGGFGADLAQYVAHEAAHLLGYEHIYTPHTHDEEHALAEVAFKPYTHVEIAKDVRDDLLADGLITISGTDASGNQFTNTYTVHPRILEALEKYPSFYYAGAVGPDGFPDVTMGQRNIHPNDTGTWIARVFDMAWVAQTSPSYTEVERLQILAFAYGFATHAAGDLFAHTLVNEFTEGVFPAIADLVIGTVTSDARELANGLRHFFIEDYINQAMLRFDENGVRDLLPDGDISSDATARIAFDAPIRFIYETLLVPFPGDPSAAADTDRTTLDAVAAAGLSPARFERSDGGSFILDGFQMGMKIFGFGFANAANNGEFTVLTVSDTVVEILERPRLRDGCRRRRGARHPWRAGTHPRPVLRRPAAARGDLRRAGPALGAAAAGARADGDGLLQRPRRPRDGAGPRR